MNDGASAVQVVMKPRAISVSIQINAPALEVWDILSDLENFHRWNPFIVQAEGKLAAGREIRLRVRLHDGLRINIRPTLLSISPPEEIRWLGSLPIPGLVEGEHSLSIQPLEDRRIRFVQHEIYNGILVPILWFRLKQDAIHGFSAMNAALKSMAEGAFPMKPGSVSQAHLPLERQARVEVETTEDLAPLIEPLPLRGS